MVGLESILFGNMLTFDCQYTCCTLNMSTETIDDGKTSLLLGHLNNLVRLVVSFIYTLDIVMFINLIKIIRL